MIIPLVGGIILVVGLLIKSGLDYIPRHGAGASASTATRTRTVYAIGDLHGDVECAIYWVESLNVIDGNISDYNNKNSDNWKWRDQSVEVVFMGDYIDKGYQVGNR